eukprot:CAMPEP_0170450604 /NCGR_PEP_ID=MMETSP0123-20130129/82_1 /TAXON_ID=182087 /ORGANISM="Favella ehrenbergii, Strain Fehren 1" /LENGTH=119 /DNA_ID=CAMNT_0010711935 /DNA_START=590 /DNA_END=950 /DNA_ORIENTATION=+
MPALDLRESAQGPIVDVAFSLELLPLLDDERKIQKYLMRVRDLFEVTSPAMLKQVYDQDALTVILVAFKRYQLCSITFKERIALLLQNIVKNKKWKPIRDSKELADITSCLRDIEGNNF